MAVNQTFFLRASVGAQPGALNVSQDVMAVQTLLNEHAAVVGFEPLTVNGEVSPTMIEDIRLFQKKIVGLRVADGRVDPNGVTIAQLNRPLSRSCQHTTPRSKTSIHIPTPIKSN